MSKFLTILSDIYSQYKIQVLHDLKLHLNSQKIF